MPENFTLTDAASALRKHFGTRLESGHDDGLKMMADKLHVDLGISQDQARSMVTALEQVGTIRWVENRIGLTPQEYGNTVQFPPTGLGGYWQI